MGVFDWIRPGKKEEKTEEIPVAEPLPEEESHEQSAAEKFHGEITAFVRTLRHNPEFRVHLYNFVGICANQYEQDEQGKTDYDKVVDFFVERGYINDGPGENTTDEIHATVDALDSQRLLIRFYLKTEHCLPKPKKVS